MTNSSSRNLLREPCLPAPGAPERAVVLGLLAVWLLRLGAWLASLGGVWRDDPDAWMEDIVGSYTPVTLITIGDNAMIFNPNTDWFEGLLPGDVAWDHRPFFPARPPIEAMAPVTHRPATPCATLLVVLGAILAPALPGNAGAVACHRRPRGAGASGAGPPGEAAKNRCLRDPASACPIRYYYKTKFQLVHCAGTGPM